MKSRWKTCFGKRIYQSSSGLQIYQNPWFRWMTFNNDVLQTLLSRHHPEKSSLEYIIPLTKMARAFPGDCCLLGLGGAAVPHALNSVMAGYEMVAVESSQEIIKIANQFFQAEKITDLSIIHQNAQDFVRYQSSRFQHLIVDLYDADDYPADCDSAEFFTQCHSMLNPDGVMAINLTRIYDKIPLFQKIQTQFNQCTLIVPVPDTANTVVLAGNMLDSQIFMDAIQQTGMINRILWDKLWGYIGAI